MENRFDIIIFDWSGTISDDRLPVYEANKRILKSYGINLNSFDKWLKTTNGSIISYCKSLGIEEDKEIIFNSYKEAYNQVVEEGIAPNHYADAVLVLSHLRKKDKTLAIVSSHPQFNLEEEVAGYGMQELFKIIKGNSLDKSFDINQIIERNSCMPERTVYIGDMIQDIEAASKSGIPCAVVTTGYHSKERLEKANPSLGVFDNLVELSKILV